MVILPKRKIEVLPTERPIRIGDETWAVPKQVEPLLTKTKIDPSKYVLLQEGERANCAVSTHQLNDGVFYQLNKRAIEQGLVAATPRQFLINVINTNAAVNNAEALYDASGILLKGNRLAQHANRVNSAWVYLNARFPKGTGHKGLDIVTITGVEKDGQLILERQPLQSCLEEDCLADVSSMNSQGLLTQKAKTDKYEPGKTAMFYSPVLRQDNPEEGYVARFLAGSVGALLYCYRRTDYSNPSLGVILCA
ncbi:MAG: hypothetical protein NT076_04200, partial [Candidatus Pacearchaeota archaeon]|nr:hypothetical protein [Candidatus Pacearchaeota archaeon]